MPDHVRVRVVGTSWWAELMYLPILKRHPGAELVAVCGRRREHVDQIARKYGIPNAFTNYRDMIEQAGLHALVISTPDDLHYPITLEALDAGLHMLYENLWRSTSRWLAPYTKSRGGRCHAQGLVHLSLAASVPARTPAHRRGVSRASLPLLDALRMRLWPRSPRSVEA